MINFGVKEMLINCLRGMKRKAHGAQKPRHIKKDSRGCEHRATKPHEISGFISVSLFLPLILEHCFIDNRCEL